MWLIPILAVLLLVGAVALAQTDKLKLAKGITSKIDMSLPFQQQKAAAVEPGNEKPHLYLAMALAQQYIPGVDTTDNKQTGTEAISEYRKVLELNPDSIESINCVPLPSDERLRGLQELLQESNQPFRRRF